MWDKSTRIFLLLLLLLKPSGWPLLEVLLRWILMHLLEVVMWVLELLCMILMTNLWWFWRRHNLLLVLLRLLRIWASMKLSLRPLRLVFSHLGMRSIPSFSRIFWMDLHVLVVRFSISWTPCAWHSKVFHLLITISNFLCPSLLHMSTDID